MIDKDSADGFVWKPMARPQFSAQAIVGIVARHALPVITTLWLHWSLNQFMVLTVFNISLSISSLAGYGALESTIKGAGLGHSTADRIGMWFNLTICLLFFTLLFTAIFGWVVFARLPAGVLRDRSLWLPALSMVMAAMPGIRDQVRADLRAKLGQGERRQRDTPVAVVLLTSGTLILLLSWYLPRENLVPLMLATTAFFIFRDLRPDLVFALSRPIKRLPQAHKAESDDKKAKHGAS